MDDQHPKAWRMRVVFDRDWSSGARVAHSLSIDQGRPLEVFGKNSMHPRETVARHTPAPDPVFVLAVVPEFVLVVHPDQNTESDSYRTLLGFLELVAPSAYTSTVCLRPVAVDASKLELSPVLVQADAYKKERVA